MANYLGPVNANDFASSGSKAISFKLLSYLQLEPFHLRAFVHVADLSVNLVVFVHLSSE